MTESTILTVTELTLSLKNLLETRFATLKIQGEITNFKPNSSGHLYFDLKDNSSKISAVMFRSALTDLSRLPKEGDQIIATGALSLYPPHGKYQIVVRSIEFSGVGALLLQLEELKKKLKAKGWFEEDRKKPLPKFPKRIGVVTSPTGAVIRDIIQILKRRHSGFHLILNPVKVQGNEAAAEIASAIDDFNKFDLVDVLIVGRGGGSLEDLWPFNDERVAEAIFRSRIPIISAVGHETDFTIADFVADLRAPTPSAAAEIVTKEKSLYLTTLQKNRLSIEAALLHHLKTNRERLKRFVTHPIFASSHTLTATAMQKLDDVEKELKTSTLQKIKERVITLQSKRKELFALKPSERISHFKQKTKEFEKRLEMITKINLEAKKESLKQIALKLSLLDPKNVLKRGYAILFAINSDSVIVSADELSQNDRVRALLTDGTVELSVLKDERRN